MPPWVSRTQTNVIPYPNTKENHKLKSHSEISKKTENNNKQDPKIRKSRKKTPNLQIQTKPNTTTSSRNNHGGHVLGGNANMTIISEHAKESFKYQIGASPTLRFRQGEVCIFITFLNFSPSSLLSAFGFFFEKIISCCVYVRLLSCS